MRFGLSGTEGGRGTLLPWLIGSLLAAVAAYALTVPLWRERAEGLSSDFLFRFGRLNPPRASSRLVHVDIDDSSLDTFGRWPWKRSLFAEAIAAIDEYGPTVIALDLLFDEPDLHDPAEDAALVETLSAARARVVVAVKFPEIGDRLGPLWTGEQGAAALRRVIDALKSDITLDSASLVDLADLDDLRAQRVRDRRQSFRERAIEEAAREVQSDRPLTVENMLDRLLPASKRTWRFQGVELAIRKVIDRMNAARHYAPRLPELGASGVVRLRDRLESPMIEIARTAHLPGFVTTDTDRDGAIRRVAPLIAFEGRLYPQLGVAAAMAHLGLGRGDIRFEAEAVRIGQATLPLSEGATLVAWPRFEDGPPLRQLLDRNERAGSQGASLSLLRQEEADSATAGHIAIGHVLETHQKFRLLDAKKREYDEIARELLATFVSPAEFTPQDWDDPQRRPAAAARLLEHVAWSIGGADGQVASPSEDAPPEDKAMWRWHQHHVSLPAEEAELLAARQRLSQSIRDKIVFVGWVTTGSLSDVYPTAAGPLTPGVVVNAMMANMVLTGATFRESPLWIGALLTFSLGSFTAFVAGMRSIRPLLGLLLACIITLGYLLVNAYICFDTWRVFVPLATPLAGTGLGLFGSTFARSLHERSERSRLTRQFGNRIHRRLFEYLLEHPDVIDMSGAQREVTCLFGDLAGFTSVSESMDSRTTVALLNRYMGSMNALLTEHSAYVNKFLGDGLMAFWGAFEEDSAHADRAVRAAIACVQRVEELNLDAVLGGQNRLAMRFGLSSGLVTVGDCGAPPEFSDFTVIGDSVNLAARLESANKQFGTSILINARTNEMLGPDVLRRPVGLVTVVGQSKPVELFEVLPVDPGTEDEELAALIEETAQAVRLYRDRRLDEAEAAWKAFVARHGESRLAALYLAEIARFRANAEELFDGVIRLATK